MKVILFMATTLNGVIARSNFSEDFLSNDNWQEFVKVVKNSGSLIWGRKTYEMVRTWDQEYLEPFKDITKVILSGKKDYKLDPGFVLASSPTEAVRILREKGYKETILTGGSKNNSSFAKHDLIDEVAICINPVILGEGIPLFAPENFEMKLKYIETNIVGKEIVKLRYQVIK